MSFSPTKCLSASRVPGMEKALDKHIRWNAYQLLNVSEVEVAPSHPPERVWKCGTVLVVTILGSDASRLDRPGTGHMAHSAFCQESPTPAELCPACH